MNDDSHEVGIQPRAALCSFEVVEHDRDKGNYRVTYDTRTDRVSMAVVSVVATVLDRDPDELDVLNRVLDPDALDALFRTTRHRTGHPTVAFEYAGCSVVVDVETVTVQETGDRGRTR